MVADPDIEPRQVCRLLADQGIDIDPERARYVARVVGKWKAQHGTISVVDSENRNERTADLPRLTDAELARMESDFARMEAHLSTDATTASGYSTDTDVDTAAVSTTGRSVSPVSTRSSTSVSASGARRARRGRGVDTGTRSPVSTRSSTSVSPSESADATGGVGTGESVSSGGSGRPPNPWVAAGCYLVALMAISISLNTSWRFFEAVFHIDGVVERAFMFAVTEMALVACGAGMVANVKRHGAPGHFRTAVWALVGAAAYMAWAMSTADGAANGTAQAIGRILLGPVLGSMMLHLALGLELRAHHQRSGQLARIGAEVRERLLSRLGLADDDRDAAQRTRDRAAQRAAKLATAGVVVARTPRLHRAMRAAGVAHDPEMMAKMIAERDILDNAGHFRSMRRPSPFARFEHGADSREQGPLAEAV